MSMTYLMMNIYVYLLIYPNKIITKNKTSIKFSIADEAGSLMKTLQLFARNNISLTKIQSRPLRNRPWEYLFYVDFLGHIEDKVVERVLKILGKRTLLFRVLGSYPEQGLKQS